MAMSLTAVYERFIASPNPISLAENASLHYIPTLTTHSGSGSIIRHLENQNSKVVKIKSAKTINAIEGQNALAIEVETVLEFVSGGGAYLPKLENFVADKMATLPITHIVLFDQEQKISQIRLTWDQATLLMQADVIGARGQNWPITDGKDQIRLIVSRNSAAPSPTPASPTSPRGRATNENGFAARNPSPNKKHIKDPYASLDLYGAPNNDENRQSSSSAQAIPRTSARPPPREMSELFAAGHEDLEEKPGSPNKSYATSAVAPKGAGSRKFGANRLFEEGEDEDNSFTSPKGYKTNPARYNHFSLSNEDDNDNDSFQHRSQAKPQPAEAIPMRAKTDKHGSQWDFADFVTPAKQAVKVRAHDKVNFDMDGDQQENSPGKAGAQKSRRDAEPHFEFKDDGTPVDRHAVPKPRKDAQTHFAFNDEPTPAPRRIIARTEAAKGLYRELPNESDEKPALQNISANARNNTFASHWDMTDDSPANTKNKEKGVNHQSDARKKADSHWESYDESPPKRPTSKGNHRAMQAHWSIGGDDEDVQPKSTAATGGAGGKKGFWDF